MYVNIRRWKRNIVDIESETNSKWIKIMNSIWWLNVRVWMIMEKQVRQTFKN